MRINNLMRYKQWFKPLMNVSLDLCWNEKQFFEFGGFAFC